MLAYRHAYHAGNHADVLKHVTQTAVIRYMNRKDKPYRVIDSHAGAGLYALDSAHALKTSEFVDGIARLWNRDDLPEPVADYLALVKKFNTDAGFTDVAEPKVYPGSPAFSSALLRARDELHLFEMHPADYPLIDGFVAGDARVELRQADGFAGVVRRVPPPCRRAVVLIDPSYEGLGDYDKTAACVESALERFAEAVILVWYPIVENKPASSRLPEVLKTIAAGAPKGWLDARLTVDEPDALGFGMTGSGMFVVNPPFMLKAELESVLPYLTKVLGKFPGASFSLTGESR